MRHVTLADVARDCGVSTMTVSHVVRGVNCVKPATREKVEKSLKKLGYRQNPALRALAAYRTQKAKKKPAYRATLAWLDSEASDYTEDLFALTKKGAATLGYNTEYHVLPKDAAGQKALNKTLYQRGIRGVFVGPCQRKKPLHSFDIEHFAIVGIGAIHYGHGFHSVCSDYFQGLTLAAEKCFELGFRRIAYFLSRELDDRTGNRWLGAYYAFCKQYGVRRNDLLLKTYSTPAEEIVRWAESREIEVFLTLTSFVYLQKFLPQVRFVFLNDWKRVPSHWYIDTPRKLMADEAVALLDQVLCRQEYGSSGRTRHLLIEGEWIGANP